MSGSRLLKTKIIREKKEKDSYCTLYMLRNIEARSCNQCYSGKQ